MVSFIQIENIIAHGNKGVNTLVGHIAALSLLANNVPSTPKSIIIRIGIITYNTPAKRREGLNLNTSFVNSTMQPIIIVKNKARKTQTLVNNPTNITTANITAVIVRVLKVFLFKATLIIFLLNKRMERILPGHQRLFLSFDPGLIIYGNFFQQFN